MSEMHWLSECISSGIRKGFNSKEDIDSATEKEGIIILMFVIIWILSEIRNLLEERL